MKGIFMKASESMSALYKIVDELKGPLEAKKFVSGTIYSIISDLQEEQKPVSPEAIEEELAKLAQDFIEVTRKKNDVA